MNGVSFVTGTPRMTMDLINIVLSALAGPTRRQALGLLWQGRELCVCELMSTLGVTQSRMSRHMSVLKAAGLVLDRRDAQWVRYRRNPEVPRAISSIVESVLSAMTVAPRRVAWRQTSKVRTDKVSA
jgi:ArsR family transcriptional regulator